MENAQTEFLQGLGVDCGIWWRDYGPLIVELIVDFDYVLDCGDLMLVDLSMVDLINANLI